MRQQSQPSLLTPLILILAGACVYGLLTAFGFVIKRDGPLLQYSVERDAKKDAEKAEGK